MGKDKKSSNTSDIKKSNGSGSKTSKPIKKSEPTIKNNKKKFTGSKTDKSLINSKNKDQVSEELDINKIFDIIDSETKRKENNLKKKKEINDVIDTINDNIGNKTKIKENNTKKKKETKDTNDSIINTNNIDSIKGITKSTSKKSIVNVSDSIDETSEDKPHNIDKISKKAISSYLEAKKFLKDHNISISTITLDCKLHTLIDVDKFAKNVVLKEDEIVSVKFGNRKDPATNRTIVVLKTKKKPSLKNFYNQVTILMKPMNNPTRNYINIKVFKNGSLQMTGCKDMDDFNNVTTTLIKILKRGRDVKNKNGKIVHVDFIDNPKEIGIYDIKIRMINSNFKLDYKVDRKKLAKLLKKNHRPSTKDKEIGYVECKYEPTGGHSCVNIKYKYDEKNKPSIFVFQTGAVIITGAKNLPQIIMAYHFIHKILNKYYNEIRIIDLDQKEVQAAIANFFKKNKNKQNLVDA
ncbi:TATA-box-binding protein-like protein [Tupanvirus deep ocean]|uniref:TATA-box-binding protein-like protein n=2 Tax=Tupanvirus TaxID=2094720 RepID=A0AC62A8N5_9VIRU|nr:TATA-box-binding protein-like protein [Tupanvirus deep ocean]QKU34136.1 TATA-box-binding protein-like protein [Tupanvirus deep ocean]